MTQELENKLRMYFTVCAVCDSNTELLQENEAFKSSYIKFQSHIPAMQKYMDILKMENIATESLKSIDRVELEEMGFYISGKLMQYARKIKNENLFIALQENRNNLMKASDIEFYSICNYISGEAAKNVEKLAFYGITADNIAEFQQLINYFSFNINRVRASTSKNKSTYDLLIKHFREADDLLKQKLDADIEFFKNSDPEFYNQYKAARIIIDLNKNFHTNSHSNNVVDFANNS